MADRALTGRDRRVAEHPQHRGRVALRIALIYLCARVFTTGCFLLAGAMSGTDSRFGASASLADFVGGWDAQWYALIATTGYPTELPLTDDGEVAENAWAFMPVFPYVAGAVGALFGSWTVGAFLVALTAGYLACLALFAVLRDRIGGEASLWAVVFFSSAPLAAMFQVGYAEALFMLSLLLAIMCVQRRQYWPVYPLVLLLAFTRPGVLAFALFLGIFGITRWWTRAREPLHLPEVVHIVLLGMLACATGFAWPLIAGTVTGDAGAYLATELAWRRGFGVDHPAFAPFLGWLDGAQFWGGFVWGWRTEWAIVAAIALLVAACALLWEPHVRRLGVEVRVWVGSYLVYLVAVIFPQSSVFRLLLPVSPVWGAVAQPRSPWWRGGVLALCLAGQWWWIWMMYGLGNHFTQIP